MNKRNISFKSRSSFFTGMLIFLLAFTLQQCSSSLMVKTDYDKETDFTRYKKFAFYQYEDKNHPIQEVNKRRIYMGIEEELARKGIKLSNDPDLLINIYTIIQRQEGGVVRETQGNWGVYGGYGTYGSSFGISYSTPQTYHISGYATGDVVVDLVDRKNMKLVLQGVVNTTVHEDDRDVDKKIKYVIKKIFQKIPDVK